MSPSDALLSVQAVSVTTGAAVPGGQERMDWAERKVREWLLLLLRFAITRELEDQMAAYAMADEIDALGLHWRPSGPRFFLRTSHEICAAIVEPATQRRTAILRRHALRIDDVRLREAFEAAVRVHTSAGRVKRMDLRRDLWRGLKDS
jgi:hypothetical protein